MKDFVFSTSMSYVIFGTYLYSKMHSLLNQSSNLNWCPVFLFAPWNNYRVKKVQMQFQGAGAADRAADRAEGEAGL